MWQYDVDAGVQRTVITQIFSFKGVLGVVQFLGVHEKVLSRVPIDGVDVPPRK